MKPEIIQQKRLIRILRIIRERPGITKTELSHATRLTEIERDTILDKLIEQNQIRVEKQKGTGRPTLTYWPVTESASPQTQPEPRSSDGEFHAAQITLWEIGLVNADRRRRNEISAGHGLPAVPMLPLA
jgi:predicted ArsR family transcriptional regulator